MQPENGNEYWARAGTGRRWEWKSQGWMTKKGTVYEMGTGMARKGMFMKWERLKENREQERLKKEGVCNGNASSARALFCTLQSRIVFEC